MKQLAGILILTFMAIHAFGQNPIYSFFCAGHTYGNPNNVQYGLHANFVDYFPELNANHQMELGFLTGDVVAAPTAQYWDSAQLDMAKLNMPLYIAAGNHDISQEFVNRFGDYYFAFQHQQDLFIVLTPGLNQWNIEGDQLLFLEQTLNEWAPQSRYIFIMLHELIWWSPDNIYQDVIINYVPHYPGSTNFEEVVKPLLLSYPNKIFLYAGDVGATSVVSPCMYHQYENLTIMASGMGSLTMDNIIITEVYEDYVKLDLVALNGDNPNTMGELSDWAVNTAIPENSDLSINIFPNPCQDYLEIRNPSMHNMQIIIYNMMGKEFINRHVQRNQNEILDISSLKNGMYILHFSDQEKEMNLKLIKN